jgi:hypothetical protein
VTRRERAQGRHVGLGDIWSIDLRKRFGRTYGVK